MDDTEVEEGEACYYKDDTSIDPDIALSYIDEKLQSVLGHFQKDFEGGVSAENLGAKFGGYGSFLPSYQRSPSIRSHPKNLKEVQSFSSPESPNVLPVEGAAQYSTVPSDAVQSSRLGTAPRSLPSLHSAMTPSGDFSAKKDSCLSSAQGKKLPIKDEPVSNKQVRSSDQRTLKVRIKMNSDTIAKDKAAIYSGLGLTSSSSSMGNSPEDSSGMPSQCPGTLRESLSNILKIMTSFPVPGGSLLSPLTESLICLEMKEKLPRNISPVKTINKVSKERKKKVVEKRDNLVISKGEICMNLGDRRTNRLKQEVDVEVGNMGSETLVYRSCIFSDKNPRPVSSTACSIVDSMKDADMAPRVPEEAERSMSVKKTEVIKNTMEDILSLGFVEEESLESISGQNGGNFERRDFRSSSIENISESQSRNSCRDDSTDRRGDARSKRNDNSTLFKADSDVSNCSRDPFGQTAMNHEKGEVKMPHGAGKSSLRGKKKSKRSQNSGNLASEAEGCLMSESYEVPKEKKRSGKMRNLQPQTTGDHMINQIGYLLERPSGIRANNSNQGFFEMKQGASLNKSKELSTHKGIDAQLTSGSSSKEAANSGHPSLQAGVISVMEPTPAAPIVIEEDWVCCDRCQKWRLLPYGTKPDQLPEKWMCSMLNWLPGMNRCDISEDDTTQALHALYQPVLPKSQINLKNHVDRTVPGASSADGSYLGQNHQNLGSHCMPNPQKKKQKSKETHWAVSNGSSVQISGSVKKFQPDVVKSRSLNDMNQPCSGSNLMSNSHIQPLSKPHKFPVGKNTHIQKEKQVNHVAGDAMEKALKSKRPADQYECGTTKKIRVDVASGADKCLSTGKVPISAKKEGESLETGSSEMKTYGEKEISLKKRKLKDWQESQNYTDASKNNGNHLPESKAFVKEESSDSEFRKVKKSTMSNREGRQAILSKGDERLNSEGKVTKLKNPVYGREEFNIEKDHKARKHKTKGSAYDDMDILKRDLGSDQFSRAATSSSSKVSDSRKSRSQFLEVKGSPVESVSSSPIRTSNLDKLSPARKDNLRKNTLKNGDILMMHFPKKSLDREGNVESNLAGTAKREKASAVSHPKSLGFSVLDFRDENDGKKFGGKSRLRVKSPDRYRGVHLVKNEADTFDGPRPGDLQFSDHCHSEDKRSKNLNHDNALFQEKSRSSSLLSRCKDGSSGNNTERIKVKLSDRSSGMLALNLKENMKDELKNGPNHVALLRGESSDLKCRIKLVKDDSDTKSTRITPQLQQIQVVDDKVPKKSDLIRIGSRVGSSSQVISSDAVNKDPLAHLPPSIPPSQQGSALNVVPVDYSCNGDSSKVLKQSKDAPCPLRKDDSSQVASTALKEAEKFKGYADRLKDSGFGFECNEAYFQAALKFLHGASLLETCNFDGSKRGGLSQMQIYSNAAKLFELCAQEYEKCHDMAAAALTYKCMEVAYMRVVYCKNSSMNRDLQDLQASLQMVPQGESPSSSASDVDSLNNQVMVDNAALSKGNSSHVGKHTIAARNRPNFIRLLDFTKDVNSAMEASYKSQNAFAAANVILEEAQNKEGIISVKRVIDLSFQDVEELLRLVRLAIDSTSRQGFGGNKD